MKASSPACRRRSSACRSGAAAAGRCVPNRPIRQHRELGRAAGRCPARSRRGSRSGKASCGSWPSRSGSSARARALPRRGRSRCAHSSSRSAAKKSKPAAPSAGAPRSDQVPLPDPGRPSHDLAPLDRAHHGAGEAVERHVAPEERLEHAAQERRRCRGRTARSSKVERRSRARGRRRSARPSAGGRPRAGWRPRAAPST